MNEATARIKINKLLEAAGWRFFAEGDSPANICLEPNVTIRTSDLDALGNDFEKTSTGFIDFLLLDTKGFPYIVLEAKSEDKNPLVGKEQARKFIRVVALHIATVVERNAEGIGVRGVTRNFLSELQIPLPPLEVQKEIVGEIEGYQKVIDGARAVVDNYRPHIAIDPDWLIVPIAELAELEYGFTAKAEAQGDVRFIRITDISEDGPLHSTAPKFITLTDEARNFLLKKGDILVARTGATYGKTMLFEEDYPAVFASYLIRLRFSSGRVSPGYYWAFVQSNAYWHQAKALVTGGGQPQFNGHAIKKILLPLPPLESDRLKSALSSTDDAEPVVSEAVAEPAPTDNDVGTTEEEWRAYYVVTAILTPDVPADRVTLRDGKHYCSVLLDNTNRQPICRLHFNTAQKRLGLVDANKSEERVPVDDVSDIFAHAGRIRETVQRYLEKAVQPAAAP